MKTGFFKRPTTCVEEEQLSLVISMHDKKDGTVRQMGGDKDYFAGQNHTIGTLTLQYIQHWRSEAVAGVHQIYR